jgi:LysM repeat protein
MSLRTKTVSTCALVALILGSSGLPAPAAAAGAPKVTCIYRKVARGETLAKLGRRYGVTVKELMRVNRLRYVRVKPGQRLCIPTRGPAKHDPPAKNDPPAKPDAPASAIQNSGDGNTFVVVSGDGNNVNLAPASAPESDFPMPAPPLYPHESWSPYLSPPGRAEIGNATLVPGDLALRQGVATLSRVLGDRQTINIARAVTLSYGGSTITLAPRGPDAAGSAEGGDRAALLAEGTVTGTGAIIGAIVTPTVYPDGDAIGLVFQPSQEAGPTTAPATAPTTTYAVRAESRPAGELQVQWFISYVDANNRVAMTTPVSVTNDAPLSDGQLNAAIDVGSRWCRLWIFRWAC